MDVWGNILSSMSSKLDPSTLKLLKGVEKAEYRNGELYISAPDPVYKDWLENNLLDEIKISASSLFGENLKIFVLSEDEEDIYIDEPVQKVESKPYRLTNLNPKFVFSNFIVGNCNKIAYSACMSVAENLGKIYNPLFIYGGIGLGKTHLLHATAHYVLSKNPDANIIYTTADTFMSELIYYMQNGSVLEFRRRYRDVDLLLIDDVQFLEGKERTQIELYHIFNALHLIGKQVILSSDTPPKNLKGLQERLKSRFVSGLVVEVKAPDLQTKISIINKKSRDMNIKLPNDVILLIAKTINTNIRELEGSLSKLKAYSEILGRPVTFDMAREVLKDILEIKEVEELSIEKIQREVSNYFGVNINELLGNSRKKKVATARQIAMYLSRYLTDRSLSEISKAFKKKDHSTVINAVEKVEKNMEKDRKFRLTVEFLKEKIMSL
ncbi:MULTISPECIES: chromosomal replication initiator protein DnaA [Persephonella]|uniref:Chromosomal replication initiator protein DnaA n=1 Tax=Persephonella marina (strain DSM 14350 / EX-H1) TaxID=123214 RepID=C0QPV0_PERMH|nr:MULTISPECIES: chromosomal replication initiator protein DnaA [Persephonella]ACO04219.1 chromosomal replication initiator protein DnaA [Persephonella marina EX-H1]